MIAAFRVASDFIGPREFRRNRRLIKKFTTAGGKAKLRVLEDR